MDNSRHYVKRVAMIKIYNEIVKIIEIYDKECD